MALPLLIALAYLIDAALIALAYLARRALAAVAVALAWDYVKPRLLDWAREYAPTLVIKWINYSLGIDLRWPITPASLTAAVNEKLGQNIFTDVTDREAVRRDCARLALARLNAAIPGLALVEKDFTGTATAKKKLLHKMRMAMTGQIRAGMESGASVVLPAPVVVDLMAALRLGYTWQPHVNETGLRNEIGREMARWYARHLTRTWTPK